MWREEARLLKVFYNGLMFITIVSVGEMIVLFVLQSPRVFAAKKVLDTEYGAKYVILMVYRLLCMEKLVDVQEFVVANTSLP